MVIKQIETFLPLRSQIVRSLNDQANCEYLCKLYFHRGHQLLRIILNTETTKLGYSELGLNELHNNEHSVIMNTF